MSSEPRGVSRTLSSEPLVGVRHSTCGTQLEPIRAASEIGDGTDGEIGKSWVPFCRTCRRSVPASEFDPPGAICLADG